MADKQQIIISAYREGKSQRAIARETGIDRKTIRTYLKKYETTREKLLTEGENETDIRELNFRTLIMMLKHCHT